MLLICLTEEEEGEGPLEIFDSKATEIPSVLVLAVGNSCKRPYDGCQTASDHGVDAPGVGIPIIAYRRSVGG